MAKKKAQGVTRRERSIFEIRKQIGQLKESVKKALSEEEELGLALLLDERKQRLKILRKLETNRKRRWRRKHIRKDFYKDPFKAAKEVLKPRVCCELNVSKEQLDNYVNKVTGDPLKEVPLGEIEGLQPLALDVGKFNNSKFNMVELEFILRGKRNGSKPGPNKIPYKVYKKCRLLRVYLLKLTKDAQGNGKAPLGWRISDGFFYS